MTLETTALALTVPAMPISAWAGPASMLDVPPLSWLPDISLLSLLANLLSLISLQLVIGFLIGLSAAELGRMAWKTSQGVWKATVSFGSVAAQYGAIAVLLAGVLYFI